MKSLLVLVCISFSLNSIRAQELWGTAGNIDWTLFKTNKNQTDYYKTNDLSRNKSSYPKARLVEATNGKLYGTTLGYESFQGIGSIYEIDPFTGVYRLLQNFYGLANNSPSGGMIQASNGLLYGLTFTGPNSNIEGGIFSYDILKDTLVEVLSLAGNTNIFSPQGEFLEATNGKLYAVSAFGGTNNSGTIFEYDIATNAVSILFDFNDVNGARPIGTLIQIGNILYGLTNTGGSNQEGVLFSYNLSNANFQKLVDLDSANSGSYPTGGLVEAINGKLYGLTEIGGTNNQGVVFEYNIATNRLRKIVDLKDTLLGAYPSGSWMQATDSNLYALCLAGGLNNYGSLIQLNLTTDSVSKVFDFEEEQGRNPYSSLMQASDGKLYGSAFRGGMSERGTLYTFDIQNGIEYDKVFDFYWYSEGFGFWASPIQAMDGNLYGITNSGGGAYNNGGTLYRLNPYQDPYSTILDSTLLGYRLEKLLDFDSSKGSGQNGRLIEVEKGLLIGTSTLGGAHNQGVIFSYNYLNGIHSKLYDFDSTVVGAMPSGNLVLGDNGKIYGTTEKGGRNGYGTIYEFDLSTNTVNQLAELSGSFTSYFNHGLMQASNGSIYAIANSSFGNDYGAIVKYDFNLASLETVTEFRDVLGGGRVEPNGVLMEASDGFLYGLTGRAGRNGQGTIYRLDLQTDSITIVHGFTGSAGGRKPDDRLIEVNGKLFGVTREGGNLNNLGTLFSYDMQTDTFSKLFDMRNGEGVFRPNNALVAVDSCHQPFVSSLEIDASFVCLGDSVELQLGVNSELNDGGIWNLYKDSLNGSPFQTGTGNAFKFWLDSTATIYIKAAGGCAENTVLDSIDLIVKYIPIDTGLTGGLRTLTVEEDSATYQWYSCGTILLPIEGANGQSFSPLKNGSYAVEITKNGCSSFSACKLVSGVGIEENGVDLKHTVFPNPSNGKFLLKVADASSKLEIFIHNIQGQLIHEQYLSNSSQMELEILGEAGIYFLSIRDEQGKLSHLKLLKQ